MTLDVFNPIFCGKQGDIPANLQYRSPYQKKHLQKYMKILGIPSSGWSKQEMCEELSRPSVRNKLNSYVKKGKYSTPIITPNSNINSINNNNNNNAGPSTYQQSPNKSIKKPSRTLLFLAKQYKVPLTTKVHRLSKKTRTKTITELKLDVNKKRNQNNYSNSGVSYKKINALKPLLIGTALSHHDSTIQTFFIDKVKGAKSLQYVIQYANDNIDDYFRALDEFENFQEYFSQQLTVPTNNSLIRNTLLQFSGIWKPQTGPDNLIMGPNCFRMIEKGSLSKTHGPVQINKVVYLKCEVLNNSINYVYNLEDLKKHLGKHPYAPTLKWKKVKESDILMVHPTIIQKPDTLGVYDTVKLLKLSGKNQLLKRIIVLLTKVHTMNNSNIIWKRNKKIGGKITHHRNTNNGLTEIRWLLGAQVSSLYLYIKSLKDKKNKVAILEELDKAAPICLEGVTGYLEDFLEIKKSGVKSEKHDSLGRIPLQIGKVGIKYVNHWCKQANSQKTFASAQLFFLGKLKTLFTRIQGELMNQTALDDKSPNYEYDMSILSKVLDPTNKNYNWSSLKTSRPIHDKDVKLFLREQGLYLLNCQYIKNSTPKNYVNLEPEFNINVFLNKNEKNWRLQHLPYNNHHKHNQYIKANNSNEIRQRKQNQKILKERYFKELDTLFGMTSIHV